MPPVGFEPTISAGERPCRSPAEVLGSNPIGTWIFVCCECRVLSGRGLCVELITRPEESYRRWCVVVCDLETSRMGAPCSIYIYIYTHIYIYIYDIISLRVKVEVQNFCAVGAGIRTSVQEGRVFMVITTVHCTDAGSI